MIKNIFRLLLIICFIFISTFSIVGCDLDDESTSSSNLIKISMPYDDDYYETYSGTLEELVKELEDLGFTNIKTEECSYSGYEPDLVKDITIEGEWFGFEKGDVFKSNKEVKIEYYTECLNLTIDNCEDLKNILTNESANYLEFLEEYDGKYVEFDGCVTYYSTYLGGTSHIVYVNGGDYDANNLKGLHIKVNIDVVFDDYVIDEVEVGQNIKLIGKVSEYSGEYYKMVYLDAVYFQYR